MKDVIEWTRKINSELLGESEDLENFPLAQWKKSWLQRVWMVIKRLFPH